MSDFEIRALEPAELLATAALLAAAFEHDPLMRYLFRGNRDHLGALGRLSCEYRLAVGWPVLALDFRGQLAGVASCSLPDPHGKEQLVDEFVRAFAHRIGPEAFERYEEYSRVSMVGAPTGRVHYLGIIGVDPTIKGKGLGRHLLEAVHSLVESDQRSEGVWLDTESEANVAWYQRQGYRVLGEQPFGETRVWVMFRPSTGVPAG